MAAPVNLTYRIPKNLQKTLADQKTAFFSLELNQGELELLEMTITANAVVDGGTYLERNLTLTPNAPGFVDAFGASENPSTWGLATLWGSRIEKGLSTRLVP
jgi:hypothetical protein